MPLFYLELIINWAIPFTLLLSNYLVTHKNTLLAICSVIIIGQWIDLYQQVIVGTYGKLEIGWIEIGMFLGFAGLFAYITARALASAPLVPKHHPYLEESLKHH
jgi:sugar phosphate permease